MKYFKPLSISCLRRNHSIGLIFLLSTQWSFTQIKSKSVTNSANRNNFLRRKTKIQSSRRYFTRRNHWLRESRY
ncbi:hypothetical protein DCAR_0729230 [Daucus carota subsp. sativus]|uniref:Uncharacterized protein n=1 Tax=Daucus carota subsp. sativus TaxID=79200 RepID=A0AAF1BAY7_DAUCS|nr:hypothetical protein DCAR_0729230 [Daucus carota subsp. sativus]